MARALYTLVYFLLLPALIIRLWWRGRLNPGYRQRIRERFGLLPHRPPAGGIWVHAVSVGETLAAEPLIRALQQRYPHRPIIMTTTTPTGSEQVKRLFGERVFHMFLPYDIPVFWRSFLNALTPELLIVMETELWPNLMAACEQRRIPVLLANARLSDKSARGYARFHALFRPVLKRVDRVAAQYQADARRFLQLGLPEEKLTVTGSIKFDVQIPDDALQQGLILRQQWGEERTVLALASGHAGEDEQLLADFVELEQAFPGLLLLLIPRHPERFDEVVNAARQNGLRVQRRSQGETSMDTQVYLADSMGEMMQLLAAADWVLMGGSLIPHGGHNPIEPAALGKATLIGPWHHNFASVVETLKKAGALQVLQTDQALAPQLIEYLSQPNLKQSMGEAGLQTVSDNRGAVAALMQNISELIPN